MSGIEFHRGTQISPEDAVDSEWPVVNSSDISIINSHGHIAVATLWTKRDALVKKIHQQGVEDVVVVGQLYSPAGVNKMIRNLLANKNIRYLVLSGADLWGSGDKVMQIWQEGAQADGIANDLPPQAIEQLRQHVQIIDMRYATTTKQVADVVVDYLPQLKPVSPWGFAEHYSEPEVEVAERLPSGWGAEVIKGEYAHQVWPQLLEMIMKFGVVDETNYGERARDLQNMVVTVRMGDPFDPTIPDFFSFSRSDLEAYVEEFLAAYKPEDVFYTYGQRLRLYGDHGVDQIEIIEDKLRTDPNDRGAIMVLYDVERDNRRHPETEDVPKKDIRTPCLTSVQFNIADGELHLTAYFRSQDVFGAWPLNFLALRRLQAEVAQNLGVDVGTTTTISNRAHIYEHAWDEAEIVISQADRRGGFRQDPRGSFRLWIDDDSNMRATHMHPDCGEPLGPDFVVNGSRKKAAEALARGLANAKGVSQIEHAFDLGIQSALMEIAVKLGIPFEQDADMVERIINLFNQLSE